MDRLTADDERYLDEARRRATTHAPPPTVAETKADGCIGFYICCSAIARGTRRCGHSRLIRWEVISLPDDLPFPEICKQFKARCTQCGSRSFHIAPDATHRKTPRY